jgi:hypothetical protein
MGHQFEVRACTLAPACALVALMVVNLC